MTIVECLIRAVFVSQGSRLGITTVVSTDSIRHMMRGFADEKQNPLLYASTYHAGDYLDPIAVAQAKAKRKANKPTIVSHPNTVEAKISLQMANLIMETQSYHVELN